MKGGKANGWRQSLGFGDIVDIYIKNLGWGRSCKSLQKWGQRFWKPWQKAKNEVLQSFCCLTEGRSLTVARTLASQSFDLLVLLLLFLWFKGLPNNFILMTHGVTKSQTGLSDWAELNWMIYWISDCSILLWWVHCFFLFVCFFTPPTPYVIALLCHLKLYFSMRTSMITIFIEFNTCNILNTGGG